MNRFSINWLASVTLMTVLGSLSFGFMYGCQTQKEDSFSLELDRENAIKRSRRIIFNNDGDDLIYAPTPTTKEGFLSVRTDHVSETMVDSIFYFSRKPISPIYSGAVHTEPMATRLRALEKEGTDDLKLVIEASRKQGIEIFWSMRMNDIHDNAKDESEIAQWKREKPHLLMGKHEDKKKYSETSPYYFWTFVDYAHPEVRDVIVETFKNVLRNYDVDGVDLDFLRHPAFFQETRDFKPVTKQHLELMTDLVRQIREEVLEASSRRGKAILLSVRILPTLNQNRYFGFDIQNWVKQGYVDLIVVGGGYDPFTIPAKDMIDHGHQWGVPVYVCLSSSGFTHTIADGRFFSTDTSQWNQSSAQASDLVALQSWRAAAANAWFSGADGIMTFNLFPKYPGSRATTMARQVWKEIGDPKKLRYQDKLYAIDNLKDMNVGFMMGSVPVNDRLPIEIKKGVLAQCILPIADDLAANEEDLKSLDIRLKLTGFTGNEAITVKINKEQLNLKKGESDWLIGEIPAGVIHQGQNLLKVKLEKSKSSLILSAVEVEVKYKHSQ